MITGQGIKILIVIIVSIFLIIVSFYKKSKVKTADKANKTNNDIDTGVKTDAWWQTRFDGLKRDYEDREIYLKNKFEQVKSDYESREAFIRGMFDELKLELESQKQLTIERQIEIQRLESEILLQNRRIVELELQLLKTLGRLSKTDLTTEELEFLNKLNNENNN